nr:MAG: hypothetical protein DIU58_16800 [Sphaerobacter thermophilus]
MWSIRSLPRRALSRDVAQVSSQHIDDVPGGAGHVRRIGRALRPVLVEALEAVRDCSCGAETSCYECLRSFRN